MKSIGKKSATLSTLGGTAAIMVLMSASAQGAIITGVTIEDVSSELTASFDRAASYILDGSGVEFDEATGFHSTVPDGSMWLNNGTFTAPNDPNQPGAVITIDLGANYDLSSLTVWNYNEINLSARGANAVEILVADSVGGAFTSLGNFTFTQAPAASNVDFGQDIDLSTFADADDARLVRFDIASNHGGDNNFVGLSEVRFDGVAAIPEPSSAILALLGFAGCLRRKR